MPNVNRFNDPSNTNKKFMFKLKQLEVDNLKIDNCSIMLSPSVDLDAHKVNILFRIIDKDGKAITYAAGYCESLMAVDISAPVDYNTKPNPYPYEADLLKYRFLDCYMPFGDYTLQMYLTPRGSRPYIGTGFHFGAFLYDKNGKILTYTEYSAGKYGNSSFKTPIDITE